jgi:ribosomal protein S12 methylthiotransferase
MLRHARVNRPQTEETIVFREHIPNHVRTFIVGFPGETADQFAELVEFIRQQKFERMGVFTYSLEPDTPAAKLPDLVSAETMVARQQALMQAQQAIAFEWNSRQVGRSVDVIPISPSRANRRWVGRSWADAPDVDGLVFVTQTEYPLRAGQIVPCQIVAHKDYDLVGVAVGKPK